MWWSSLLILDHSTVDDRGGWFRVFSGIGNYRWICFYCGLIHWNILFFFRFCFFHGGGWFGLGFILCFLSRFLFGFFLGILFNFFLNLRGSLSNCLFLFFRIFLEIFSKGFHKIIWKFIGYFNSLNLRILRGS